MTNQQTRLSQGPQIGAPSTQSVRLPSSAIANGNHASARISIRSNTMPAGVPLARTLQQQIRQIGDALPPRHADDLTAPRNPTRRTQQTRGFVADNYRIVPATSTGSQSPIVGWGYRNLLLARGVPARGADQQPRSSSHRTDMCSYTLNGPHAASSTPVHRPRVVVTSRRFQVSNGPSSWDSEGVRSLPGGRDAATPVWPPSGRRRMSPLVSSSQTAALLRAAQWPDCTPPPTSSSQTPLNRRVAAQQTTTLTQRAPIRRTGEFYRRSENHHQQNSRHPSSVAVLPFTSYTPLQSMVFERATESSDEELGLAPDVMNLLPEEVYSSAEDGTNLSDEQKMCLVCHLNFEDGNCLRRLACMHRFHSSCIDTWLANKTTCPICRLPADAGLNDQLNGFHNIRTSDRSENEAAVDDTRTVQSADRGDSRLDDGGEEFVQRHEGPNWRGGGVADHGSAGRPRRRYVSPPPAGYPAICPRQLLSARPLPPSMQVISGVGAAGQQDFRLVDRRVGFRLGSGRGPVPVSTGHLSELPFGAQPLSRGLGFEGGEEDIRSRPYVAPILCGRNRFHNSSSPAEPLESAISMDWPRDTPPLPGGLPASAAPITASTCVSDLQELSSEQASNVSIAENLPDQEITASWQQTTLTGSLDHGRPTGGELLGIPRSGSGVAQDGGLAVELSVRAPTDSQEPTTASSHRLGGAGGVSRSESRISEPAGVEMPLAHVERSECEDGRQPEVGSVARLRGLGGLWKALLGGIQSRNRINSEGPEQRRDAGHIPTAHNAAPRLRRIEDTADMATTTGGGGSEASTSRLSPAWHVDKTVADLEESPVSDRGCRSEDESAATRRCPIDLKSRAHLLHGGCARCVGGSARIHRNPDTKDAPNGYLSATPRHTCDSDSAKIVCTVSTSTASTFASDVQNVETNANHSSKTESFVDSSLHCTSNA